MRRYKRQDAECRTQEKTKNTNHLDLCDNDVKFSIYLKFEVPVTSTCHGEAEGEDGNWAIGVSEDG